MNLRQFMIRSRVLKLYRDFLRSVKAVPDQSSKQELYEWIQKDFKQYKHETDEFKIRALIINGERSLKELQQNLDLSGVTTQLKTERKPSNHKSPFHIRIHCSEECSQSCYNLLT